MDNNEFDIPKRKIKHSEQDTLVSSKNVLHFTKRFDSLKGILLDGFCAGKNTENQIYLKDYTEKEDLLKILKIQNPEIKGIEIPMVCFSDIVKKAHKPHKRRYGFYGISISKDWAISNYISPYLLL